MRGAATRPVRQRQRGDHAHQSAGAHGRLSRARLAIQQLAPESIEQIALRVVALLRGETNVLAHDDTDSLSANETHPARVPDDSIDIPAAIQAGQTGIVDDSMGSDAEQPGLLTATQLAKRLGVSRSWVYENARRLGAVSLGDGPKARLRFDLETAMRALDRTSMSGQAGRADRPQPPRRRPGGPAGPTVPLLPVKRPGVRGILSAWSRRQRKGR